METTYFLAPDPDGSHKIAIHTWENEHQGIPVVCVHALTRNGRDFSQLAERLCATRSVYCPDMPGRGLSDKLFNSANYTLDQYKSDLVAWLGHMGSPRIDWVGTSMGGILGLLLAAQETSPIRRLVLNDVGALIPAQALDRIGLHLDKFPTFISLKELEAHMRQRYAAFGSLTDGEWRLMVQNGYWKTQDGRFSLAYDSRIHDAYKRQKEDIVLWPLYDAVTAPTLLIRGAQSDLLPRDVAQEMTQRGPRAQLVEIEGAGHAPALMDFKQITTIEQFLKG